MVLLDKIWDDVMAGPHPERGLEKLRKIPTPLNIKDEGEWSTIQRSLSMPASPATPGTPMTPTTPSPTAARKDNVWRSVFHPGSNIAMKRIGAEMFDKPHPNSLTVYDWLYSAETTSERPTFASYHVILLPDGVSYRRLGSCCRQCLELRREQCIQVAGAKGAGQANVTLSMRGRRRLIMT
ncbi:hypothetical protein CsSME_00029188 [Camellia sinensis var. sinensis]